MKRALHFPTKLNSRDIQKCNILFLSTLLLSVRLSSQSSISRRDVTATGVHKLRNTWSSLSEVICPRQSSTVLSKPKFGPRPPPRTPPKMPSFTTFTLTITHLIYPPTPPPARKKQPFSGVTKVYYGNVNAANPPLGVVIACVLFNLFLPKKWMVGKHGPRLPLILWSCRFKQKVVLLVDSMFRAGRAKFYADYYLSWCCVWIDRLLVHHMSSWPVSMLS